MAHTVLYFVETHKGEIKKTALEIASAAKRIADELGGQSQAVVIGEANEASIQQLAHYGTQAIHHANSDALNSYHGKHFSALIATLAQDNQASVILASASALGKDLLPRVAARLNVSMASDCTDVSVQDGKVHVQRPMYGGKVLARFVFNAPISIATIRPNVLEVAASDTSLSASINSVDVSSLAESRAQLLEVVQEESSRPELTEAEVVVAGGRSLKSEENFGILFELADTLDGAVGASRAAVDAGYASHDIQVGQTGKVVNPKLYFAFGISGAIQHLAGMRTSKVIVAINKDAEAPIFEHADYGMVADLFEMAPLLTQEFKTLLND